MSTKNDIFCGAHELGADDVAFVKDDTDEGLCVIVLFFKYCSSPKPEEGYMSLSPYYIASHHGYTVAKKLTEYIKQLGFFAEHRTDINAKSAALKHGGFIGTNGFYYHEQFGSLISMQTIKTDAVKPDEMRLGTDNCAKCNVCITVCPTGAVGDIGSCIRYHSNLSIPEHLRHGIYQLLGCELCQTACPMNDQTQEETPSFSISELLEGKHTKQLQELAGKNMARKQRILSQAAIYAANTGHKKAVQQLKNLSETAPSPVKEHASWAVEQLGENE